MRCQREWVSDMKTYCVYIMAGASGVIYIGVTNDLERRVGEHKRKAVPGFSARYNLTKLVHFEMFGDGGSSRHDRLAGKNRPGENGT